jgi:hypothetical protein
MRGRRAVAGVDPADPGEARPPKFRTGAASELRINRAESALYAP